MTMTTHISRVYAFADERDGRDEVFVQANTLDGAYMTLCESYGLSDDAPVEKLFSLHSVIYSYPNGLEYEAPADSDYAD